MIIRLKTDQSCNIRWSATPKNSCGVLIWPAQQLLNRCEDLIAAIRADPDNERWSATHHKRQRANEIIFSSIGGARVHSVPEFNAMIAAVHTQVDTTFVLTMHTDRVAQRLKGNRL